MTSARMKHKGEPKDPPKHRGNPAPEPQPTPQPK
ncbi:hypothetical protein FHX73_11744 [Kitasatospora viridis]|uniref:Uncharacterized protein n=1 Tax=Kitasatospora viridis TaxID=281105 RepID=A0A561UC85_9ACTN|nr:hypothetical protein FHX73_11744 [Kitasatospora viridis]